MIDIQSVNHILISRTDNIGDVILTLPLAIQFKQMYPNIKITFLAQDYTRALVEACPAIDEFLSWNVLSSMKQSEAIKTLQDKKLDCIIHAFPNKEIARLAKKAKIPYRIGTRRRWYHFIYCNDRINFSRAKSELHEMQLNMKLLSAFHIRVQDEINDLSQLNFLKIHTALPERLKKFLSPDRFNLIIHPLSNGNSREWPISNFIALIKKLPLNQFNILITGSAKEKNLIESRIKSQCPEIHDLSGQCDLAELIQLIDSCDGLVANSTGPLHIAAALGIHALGLYPATQGMNPKRWGPIGKKAEFLMADSKCGAPRCHAVGDCLCMESITISAVNNAILKWL